MILWINFFLIHYYMLPLRLCIFITGQI
jgi:hypothetical protein